ncbi:uncharacterized protein LOC142177141 [Nicotiana tabacum]|uniref:Uncharacterized protein LOC142177141 n=1 Tax=Nicotiana tabacum TaxID=4097 RepID=A0AC58TWU8_TOBAC
MRDDIDGLLHDTFRNIEGQAGDEEGVGERLSEDAKKFFKLLEEGKQVLYPGCENFSKLSFTIRLYLLKSLHGLSNVAFSDLLELIKEAFPLLRWKSAGPFTKASSKIPAKVLRYFPLKPRLQRIFMCSETAVAMRWHANERPNDGNLRHPTDGEAWKAFDSLHPDFSRDARNVRLGLSSDGSLGNDIDVYLRPLIEELKELWETGIDTFDAETNQTFRMCAALMWTVSDFPALAMLSGWSVKGRLECPTCNYDTYSQYLKHSHKMCYLDHQRFLPRDHPFRRDKNSFDGKEEHRPAPAPLSVEEVFEELLEFNNIFGKRTKKGLGVKSLFCTVMKNAKLPKGCASNISERVQVKEMKISGYKSHDAHFMMHYLLQVAVRKVLPKNISLALIRLGNFFRAICSKVIRRRDLETMQPEASIAEGFLADECLTFCSRYLHDGVKTKLSRYQTVDDECSQNLSPIFPNIGHPIGSKKKNTFLMDAQLCFEAHRYALFNTGDEQMEKFIEEHKNLIVNHSRSNAWDPTEKDVYYARSKVLVDLYDLEEENCPNIGEIFWRKPNNDIGSSSRLLDVDIRWSRDDVPVDIIDTPSNAQNSHDTMVETSEEEDGFDDTD